MRIKILFALSAGLLLLASPGFAKKKLLTDLALEWHPTTELGELEPISLTGLSGVKFQFGEFVDAREVKDKIGENREDDDEPPLPVTTRDDIGAWIAGRMRVLFGDFGADAVESGGTVLLSGEIRRFFVRETGVYEGDVLLKIKATTAGGKVLWEGMTGGGATRFGRSYKAENYYEVISDSVLDAAYKLLKNSEFRDAIGKQ